MTSLSTGTGITDHAESATVFRVMIALLVAVYELELQVEGIMPSGKTTGWASRDIPGYPSTSFLKWDIPG